jgi:hypothetical protein
MSGNRKGFEESFVAEPGIECETELHHEPGAQIAELFMVRISLTTTFLPPYIN